MGMTYILMGEQAFQLINFPLTSFNLTANIFFACCLMFRQRLKQPLKILLEYLVWCSIIYSFSLPLMYYVSSIMPTFDMFLTLWLIVTHFNHSSMTCFAWLNFYYYIQIVPVQKPLWMWVKRNIRPVVYIVLLIDGILFSLSGALDVAFAVTFNFTYFNGTRTAHYSEALYITDQVFFITTRVHLLTHLCMMTVSSFSTALYMYRHLRSLAQTGSSFYTPRIQSQIRVTITGILQGVIYFVYDTLYFFVALTDIFSLDIFVTNKVRFTGTTLYIFSTTVNLAIGQTVFRQRAAHVWGAVKARCGAGTATNDVKVQSIHLTSVTCTTKQT